MTLNFNDKHVIYIHELSFEYTTGIVLIEYYKTTGGVYNAVKKYETWYEEGKITRPVIRRVKLTRRMFYD